MRIADTLLIDFDSEMDKARAYFAIVPEAEADWKPHPRSATLGQVAKHVATLPCFGVLFFESDVKDFSTSGVPPLDFHGRADLMDTLATNSARLRQGLAECSDERLMADWTLLYKGQVLAKMPRMAAYRSMFLNHFIHHRAQLGVYLRLLDVPIPGIYGPSADDNHSLQQ